MYQIKQKQTGNYLLPLQLGLLLVLVSGELVKSGRVEVMLRQFYPDVLMMIVSAGSVLWFINAPIAEAMPDVSFSNLVQRVRIAWRCRGDLMHGALLPVRIIAPEFA